MGENAGLALLGVPFRARLDPEGSPQGGTITWEQWARVDSGLRPHADHMSEVTAESREVVGISAIRAVDPESFLITASFLASDMQRRASVSGDGGASMG